ncbi:predicted protein [Naegleria gruberi]|uniref:Predicted protein n=1 Tax=Naegleria gruberi TaxID=5762 RepID=D2VW97_NAEGR|nr:uncharacterized protein NAEGRDRAFT_73304 [Naegleria gruberi]EFC38792.1 predicted protein [Naegleria gruberi]|eukprot:XP_002671536.1 predicted protein [Naegleria gruberi strain NEG-M]
MTSQESNDGSISYGWWIATLLIGIVLMRILQLIMKLKRQISKAGGTPGYWQLLAEGLFIMPILSPYIAHGNFPVIQGLIAKEEERAKGSDEKQLIIRVSTPYRNNYVIWDKDSVKEVLVTKSSSFPKPLDFYEPFNIFDKDATSILTAADGPVWKNHRHVVAPSFSTGNLVFMSQVTVKTVDALFRTKWNKLLDQDSKGFIMDMEDTTAVTLQIIGESGFGMDFGVFDETSSDSKKFREALNIVVRVDYYARFFLAKIPFLYNAVSDYTGNTEALKVMSEKLEQCISQRVAEFKQDPEKPMNDLLSLLVKANMMDEKLTLNELKSNSYIFVVAGHEY